MSETLFRQEIIEAQRDRLTGNVVAAVPPSARLYTTIVVLAALAIALFLAFGSYATSAQVRGVTAYNTGIARVYSSSPAEIRTIHVTNGQNIAVGAPLVTLSLIQGVDGVSRQLGELAKQGAEITRQLALTTQLSDSETSGLRQQEINGQAAITSLERQKAIARQQVTIAESALNRASKLERQGAGTQRQVEDNRAQLLGRRAEVEGLDERIIAQRDALRVVQSQLQQRGLEGSRSQSILVAQRAAIAEQQDQLRRSDTIVLTAPVSGTVGDVSAELGQRARTDQSIVTIVPTQSRIETWVYAPSRAVAFAHPGQQVRLLFDAFPYQKFGAGSGTVMAVADVPAEPSSIEGELGIKEPVYRVRVRVDRMPPRAGVDRQAIRPGMTLTANLVLERRSLWELFFNPLLGAMRG